MKLLFLNPPSPWGPDQVVIRDINRSGRRSREGTLWPQTSLALMAAMFPEHTVQLWDCIAERWTYDDVLNKLLSFRPDWLVLETVSCTIDADMRVAAMAKGVGAKVAVISPHSEALHDETLRRYPAIDALVDYEKFQDPSGAIVEPECHLRALLTGEPVRHTPFGLLPVARQDLLPVSRYDLPLIGRGYTFVLTARGCPWTCIYCRQGVTWKNRVRYRPVAKVVEEITTYGLTNVAFHADTFTVNRDWVLQLCCQLPRGVRWICNSRVDTVDAELLRCMRHAGCWMVCYGVESGNDRVLQMNEKGAKATVAQAKDAVRWTKQAGLKVWTYMMLGLYGDTPESMQQTIDLACALNGDICNFALSAPYPGTQWGQIAEREGWLHLGSWADYDQNVSAVVDQPGCSHQQVLAAQRRAYRQWYLSPRGLRFLANAWRPRYTRFLGQVARAHAG